MNSTTLPNDPNINLQSVDRIGVAASVLCAIHCALAPILLIALPTFGKIWAHPASHIIVAVFVVPLAAYSIHKGYKTHSKRWIVAAAALGILFILGGAALPAFTPEVPVADAACATSGCVDACCPSIQKTAEGKTSLHVPPAAIVTTLGGVFLITAHIGNLCFCGKTCRNNRCKSCS